MGTKTRNKLFQFIPLDTPQHILMNYAPSMFIYGGAFCMFFALWGAWKYGNLAFLCLFAGICLATLEAIYRPPNPFFVKQLWQDERMSLKDLDPSALRVLSFFRSTEAKWMALSVSIAFTLVVLISWCIFASSFPKPVLTPEDKTLNAMLGAILAFCFFGWLSAGGTQMGVLFRYALKHWDWIQRDYEPLAFDIGALNARIAKMKKPVTFLGFEIWWWLGAMALLGYFSLKYLKGGSAS